METKNCLLGVLLFILPGVVFAQQNVKTNVEYSQLNWNALPAHPRLFANVSRLNEIKNQKNKISTILKELVINDGNLTLQKPPLTPPTSGFLFGYMRNTQGRIISLSLSYRLTDDKRYLEAARRYLMELAALHNWGTNHFLDVGEAALAAGIGYDWLYDDLLPAERQKIVTAIVTNAFEPSFKVKEGTGSWVDGDFNWNQVCHGGLVVAALAIANEQPVLSKKIVERAVKFLPYAGASYFPDGSYPEGPSYWSYGTSFHVILVEALRTVFGTSLGLEKSTGFLKTADFKNQMVGPTGADYNFSDYHDENLNEPIKLWFARELKRYDLLKDELADLTRLHEVKLSGRNIIPGKNVVTSRHLPLELFWWDPTLKENPAEIAPLHWTASGVLPLAVLRSGWNDPKATYFAIKGGTPNHSHGHMDAGSFILEADGVRWALDLGTESYDKMRAAKLDLWNYSQNSSRWSTFRVGPEGHNILRFNNGLQEIKGKGEIKKPVVENGTRGNVVELTSLYSTIAKKVERKVLLHADRSISIMDAWTTKDRAVEVSWQWLTKAKANKTSHGFLLEQDGQSLEINIEDPVSLDNLSLEVEDVSIARNTQDSANPGLSRLVIKIKSPANSVSRLSIRAYPGSVKQHQRYSR